MIVIHFGSPAFTRAAVRSVLESDEPPELVVVVDNDPLPLQMEPEWTRVRVLRPGTNLGFAAGVNYAVRECMSASLEYIWLLNNDAIAAHDALSELLIASREQDDRTVASSLIIDTSTGAPWFERAVFCPWRLESRHLPGNGSDLIAPGNPTWRAVPYLPGCSLLIPRVVWEAVGVLDETYFMYGEDVDYCARARAAGFELRLARRSIAHHSASSGTSERAREAMKAEAGLRLTLRLFPWILPIAAPVAVATALRRDLRAKSHLLLNARGAGYLTFIKKRVRGASGPGASKS